MLRESAVRQNWAEVQAEKLEEESGTETLPLAVQSHHAVTRQHHRLWMAGRTSWLFQTSTGRVGVPLETIRHTAHGRLACICTIPHTAHGILA